MVQGRIADAAARSGRAAGDVTLVAVSKYATAAQVVELAGAGQRVFGENLVQEAVSKMDATAPAGSLEWHMIGHLQTNKVARAVDRFDVIQSVDSERLARAISGRTTGEGMRVLLQVNIAGDPAKHGFKADEVREAYPAMVLLPGIRVAGLMTIGPLTASAEDARPTFAALRRLREELDAQGVAASLPHLSMGMSADFEVAIEEGATIVRVGNALFDHEHAP